MAQSENNQASTISSGALELINENLGRDILIVVSADQLNIFGQTFRPIFVGKLIQADEGHITLWPVQIKMSNAPNFEFPTPLMFPVEAVTAITSFDRDIKFPIS
ncbi:hypothetical protein JOC77_002489 [Peribacillus deserti]|uniref:Uncharacterized protein n=1 Tax=Peribacillus deserti TaxID=673318 RepID=A0ABS2QIT2_9BACI|nr:hypothetical protein [Peribacillus deserti]MBM7693050.1 hypothetical protein [Peribacillus deserti]